MKKLLKRSYFVHYTNLQSIFSVPVSAFAHISSHLGSSSSVAGCNSKCESLPNTCLDNSCCSKAQTYRIYVAAGGGEAQQEVLWRCTEYSCNVHIHLDSEPTPICNTVHHVYTVQNVHTQMHTQRHSQWQRSQWIILMDQKLVIKAQTERTEETMSPLADQTDNYIIAQQKCEGTNVIHNHY